MTDDELNQIEARANAATPGPWKRSNGGLGVLSNALAESWWVCRISAVTPFDDSSFIAAARTDVPALVAEVRRLQAETCMATNNASIAIDQEVKLMAEVQRLQNSLADLQFRIAQLTLDLRAARKESP